MSLKAIIEDGKGTGLKAELHERDGAAGLVVYTRVMDLADPKTLPFINETYGIDMNQNAALSGTAKNVHDGIDTVLWTASSILGTKYTFNSTDRAFSGTNSVKTDNADIGDIIQFTTGSLFNTSAYGALTFEINIDKDWSTDEVTLYGWDTVAGTIIGNAVSIKNYFQELSFDVWQSVNIPLVDLGLTGEQQIDAIRIEQGTKSGKGPKYYLDVISLEGTKTSAPEVFVVSPPKGTKLYVQSLKLYIADNVPGTLSNASMRALSYDKLLGLNSLQFGLNFRRIINGETDFSAIISNLSDFIFAGFEIKNTMSDGTNTFITLEFNFASSSPLDSSKNDRIEIILNDDLSDLLYMRSILNGSLENI